MAWLFWRKFLRGNAPRTQRNPPELEEYKIWRAQSRNDSEKVRLSRFAPPTQKYQKGGEEKIARPFPEGDRSSLLVSLQKERAQHLHQGTNFLKRQQRHFAEENPKLAAASPSISHTLNPRRKNATETTTYEKHHSAMNSEFSSKGGRLAFERYISTPRHCLSLPREYEISPP